MTKTIQAILKHILTDGTKTCDEDSFKVNYQSMIQPPSNWNQNEIEKLLNVSLPPDLIQLWQLAGEIRICEDIDAGQWGLILWSPDDVISKHQAETKGRITDDIDFQYHLIIGEFLGDLDLITLHCNPQENTWGNVIVADLFQNKDEWSTVAKSLSEFLALFIEAPLQKYWENNHDQS